MDWAALQSRTNAAALAAFGANITLDGVTVRGDFVAPSDQIYLDGVSAVDTRPQVVVLTSVVPAAPVGKACTANATSYTVADARPDGYGLTRLMLEAVL